MNNSEERQTDRQIAREGLIDRRKEGGEKKETEYKEKEGEGMKEFGIIEFLKNNQD